MFTWLAALQSIPYVAVVLVGCYLYNMLENVWVAKDARAGYVTEATLAASQGELKESQRLAKAAQDSNTEFQLRLQQSTAEREAARTDLEKKIADDEAERAKNGGLYPITQDDLDDLRGKPRRVPAPKT